MTWKKLLETLEEMAKEDGELRDQVDILDVLDYMAIIGVPMASELYMIANASSNGNEEALKDALVSAISKMQKLHVKDAVIDEALEKARKRV